MKFFLKRLLFFLTPIIIIGIFPLFVFVLSGELLSPTTVVNLQKGADILYLPAYGNFVKEYKAEAILAREPEIVALGTSRVTQIRADLFAKPKLFYNAGGAVSSMGDFRKFKTSLGNEKPRVFIVALDADFFDPSFAKRYMVTGYENKNTHTAEVFRTGFLKVFEDYSKNKFSLKNILSCFKNNKIGLNACVEDQGYRPDGSYQNNKESILKSKESIADKVQRLGSGESVFEFRGNISEEALKELDLFLSDSEREGIDVFGYITPYAPSVYAVLPKNVQSSLSGELPKVVGSIFEKHGFKFVGGNIIQSAMKEQDMIDAYHGNEKIGSMILFQLSKISLILPLKKLEN